MFFIKDSTWGGLSSSGMTLNPTSQAMVASSTPVIAIGGGKIDRDVAVKKAIKKSQPVPTEFRESLELSFSPTISAAFTAVQLTTV